VSPQRPELVAKAIVPEYALGSHVAPLWLTFSTGSIPPERFRNGAFIGEHGSWFTDGKPTGEPVDVLAGFVNASDRR